MVYLVLCAASTLFYTLVFTVSSVYYITVVGLEPLQLVLVGTVLEVTVLISEVPTGVVADVFSRRTSVIVGMFLVGMGFVLEGCIPRFPAILAAQVLWGVGWTFTSGAQQAWIADEMGDRNIGQIYLRGTQVGQISALFANFISVMLASIRLNLPILLAGVLFIGLGIFLIGAMPEQGFSPKPQIKRLSWQSVGDILRMGIQLIQQTPALLIIFSIGAFYGMSCEGFDRLWELHLLKNVTLPKLGNLQPIVWFGIFNAGALLLSVLVTEVARRQVDTSNYLVAARTLFAINLLLISNLTLFALVDEFEIALTTYWVIYLLRETNDPIYTAWINQGLSPQVRATLFSISSQISALGQIIGGLILGAIGDVLSIRAAMLAAAIVLVPATLLYWCMVHRNSLAKF